MGCQSQPSLASQLARSVSADRLHTYLTAAGFDEDRALRLYLWNIQIGEAFHLPIQGVEVGLRNAVSDGFGLKYGTQWWADTRFLTIAGHHARADIDTAKRRIASRGKPITTPQIVANLSFGLWTALLAPSFNPHVWSAYLASAFPALPPGTSRRDIHQRAGRIGQLRNRIAHHEPIFRMNLSEEYRATMELLTWICPVKAAWLRPHCRVPALLRVKP